jgi:hypothetical protein
MSLFQQRGNRGTEEGFTNLEKINKSIKSLLPQRDKTGTEEEFTNIEKEENDVTPTTEG